VLADAVAYDTAALELTRGATGWGGRPLLRYLASSGSAAISA